MSAPRKQRGEFDWFLAAITVVCALLLAFCTAGLVLSIKHDAACAKDPECRLVLRAHDWQCTADERFGKLTECIRYERVR